VTRDGWRDLAVILSRQLATPINVVLELPLIEAVDYYDSVVRINAPSSAEEH
jgi:hypothetical protein